MPHSDGPLAFTLSNEWRAGADVRSRSLSRAQVDEIKQLKVKQQQAAYRRHQEQVESLQKMRELEAVRKAELEARVEMERVKRRVANLDREHLQTMEREKQLELDQLAKEREEILRKEEEVSCATARAIGAFLFSSRRDALGGGGLLPSELSDLSVCAVRASRRCVGRSKSLSSDFCNGKWPTPTSPAPPRPPKTQRTSRC